MKKNEFTRLSFHERMVCLKDKGVHIGMRQLPNQKVHLYALADFFVELYVVPGTEQIQFVEIQSNQAILAEYVKDINLNDLL